MKRRSDKNIPKNSFVSCKEVSLSLPVFASGVSAGFPSPADDFIEDNIDLNEKLIKHPAATFFVRAQGSSMRDAGIADGDLLVVDRALEAKNNNVIIAVVNGEFAVKRLIKKDKKVYLLPENRSYKPIEITDDLDFAIWGVVTNVIHNV